MTFADTAREVFDFAAAHPIADGIALMGIVLGGMEIAQRYKNHTANRAAAKEILEGLPKVERIKPYDLH